MECLIEDCGAFQRVSLKGRLFSSRSAFVYDSIVGLGSAPSGRVLLNLAGVRAASPSGCRSIIVAARLLYVKGGVMAICNARPEVLDCLTARGSTSAWRGFRTEDQALRFLLELDGPDEALTRSAA